MMEVMEVVVVVEVVEVFIIMCNGQEFCGDTGTLQW